MKNINLNSQEEYWETNYENKPKMFGLAPSIAAEEALKLFKKKNISYKGTTTYVDRDRNEFEVKATYKIKKGDEYVWLHDFLLHTDLGEGVELGDVRTLFEEAFTNIWQRTVENDFFNGLI